MIVTERAFLAKVEEAINGTRIEHIVVVDGDFDLDELAARAPAGFDFEAAWRAVTPAISG